MSSDKPVLVAGEMNVDWVFSGCTAMPAPDTEVLADGFREVPGSSSMICAMGLARLGTRVMFVGRIGADARGEFCVDVLRKAGIDTTGVRRDPALATGITVALSSATDRALVTFPGSIAALDAGDVDAALLARARHLHVASIYLQRRLRPHLGELLARAHAAGVSTSLDPGFDPAGRWDDGDDWPALLRHVDVFLPNRREACAIAHRDDVDAALAALANGTTRIVVKCAGDGAVMQDANGSRLQVSTRSLVDMRDGTGAGDSFDAGFLHGWLAGRPLRECLLWGNACGSLSMRGIGGTERQADMDEVKGWLETGA